MKNFNICSLAIFLMLIGMASCDPTEAQEQEVETADSELEATPVVGYDSVKAAAYGADDYGMRKYVMAFLKSGPNREQDSVKAAELQAAHMKNINRLAEEGKLVLAGPFFGDGELRGIYVFAVNSIEEAEELTNTDPAIQSGSLVMDLKEWYGSAGLMGLNELHGNLARSGVTE